MSQETQACGHLVGEPGCGLADCNGFPPVDTPMDRDRMDIGAEPAGFETGDVTAGREMAQAVAKATGLKATAAAVANNGWSDTRRGARKVHGLLFTVGGLDVRVLSYEARPPSLTSHSSWFAAVYVDQDCVAPAIDQERASGTIPVLQAIVDDVETRLDVRTIAQPGQRGWLVLKNPPVGFKVDTARHGIATVDEASTNGGVTLRLVDADGHHHFADRASAGWWTATDADTPPAQAAVPPIFSGIPHVFQAKPDGQEGEAWYCVAPCHTHISDAVHIRPARVHVRSSSPTLVDYEGGRQGLANPTWCGRINDEKAWHVYGLKPETVTCPVCFHLFTCPWARLDDRGGFCQVCAHIGSCDDEQCQQFDHPGVVPAPDPGFDRAARADAVVERVRQAMRDGDWDAADKLIDAGDDYEPTHLGRDGWEELRTQVWRQRKAAQAPADAPTSAIDIDGVRVATTYRVDLNTAPYAAIWSVPQTAGHARLIHRATRVVVHTEPVTVLGAVNLEPSMVRVRRADGSVVRAMREHITATDDETAGQVAAETRPARLLVPDALAAETPAAAPADPDDDAGALWADALAAIEA